MCKFKPSKVMLWWKICAKLEKKKKKKKQSNQPQINSSFYSGSVLNLVPTSTS